MKKIVTTILGCLLALTCASVNAKCAELLGTPDAQVREKATRAAHIIQVVAETERLTATSHMQTVTWQVVKVWKGDFHPLTRFTITTPVDCCPCPIPAETGKSYVMYLSKENPFQISACGGFLPVNSAKDEIAILDTLPMTVTVSIK
jgi:hypothetical protein